MSMLGIQTDLALEELQQMLWSIDQGLHTVGMTDIPIHPERINRR